jgi:hypothetical protein
VSRPAIGSETVVTIDIAGELFTARGLMVVERVWLDVYPYEKWSGNAEMPAFVEVRAHTPAGGRAPVDILSERSSLSPGKRLHHQRSSRHAMVPLSDTSPHPGG